MDVRKIISDLPIPEDVNKLIYSTQRGAYSQMASQNITDEEIEKSFGKFSPDEIKKANVQVSEAMAEKLFEFANTSGGNVELTDEQKILINEILAVIHSLKGKILGLDTLCALEDLYDFFIQYKTGKIPKPSFISKGEEKSYFNDIFRQKVSESILRIRKNNMEPTEFCIEKQISKIPFGYYFMKFFNKLKYFITTGWTAWALWVMSQRVTKFYEMLFRMGAEMMTISGVVSTSGLFADAFKGQNKEILTSLFKNSSFIKYAQIFNVLQSTNVLEKFKWLTSWMGTIVSGVSLVDQKAVWSALFKNDTGLPNEGQLESLLESASDNKVVSTCTSAVNCLTTGIVESVSSFTSASLEEKGNILTSGMASVKAGISSFGNWIFQKTVEANITYESVNAPLRRLGAEVENISEHVSGSFEMLLYLLIVLAIAGGATLTIKYILKIISSWKLKKDITKRIRLGFSTPKLKIRGRCNHKVFFRLKNRM